jgi:3-hydroxyisobutyrate dehydrogenase-like beta-hydroxyacid dehydrogenase
VSTAYFKNMAESIKNVGVIGLGIIGSRVAENLRKADYHVFVWSRTPRPVENFLASPREVAEVSDAVQIFVRDAEALLEVIRDMRPALRPHKLVLCHSTVRVDAMKEAASIVADTGAFFLDAPFTGSKMAAQNRDLVYYIAGNPTGVEAAGKLLAASGRQVVNFGRRVGDATVLKIATNLVSAAAVEALAEAYAVTAAHGVSGEKLLEAFQNNANCSPLITMKLPTMISCNYEPHFSLQNMLKDARYAQLLAKSKNLVTPVLDGAERAMTQAMEAGSGDLDYSAVAGNFDLPQPEKPRLKVMGDSRATLTTSAFADDDLPA